jgi:aminoglycoside phosphotransferase (APT) family kinase protein
MSRPERDGLEWDDTRFDSSPIWTREPALDAIAKVCREKLQVQDSETCKVSFYAEGGFNKLYLARTSRREALMRVSLPVYPHHKTRGEVTTLCFLRRTTDIPVPEVIAFDDTGKNDIGFEYILMERLPGVSAYKKWRTLNMFQKVALVQRMAEIQAQLACHTFNGIGTLTTNDEGNPANEQPGEMVSGFFFWGNHFDYDVTRGPFRSSHDWLVSYIDIIIKDQELAKKEAEDEEDEEDAEFALALARRLLDLLPKVFPSLLNPAERSVIWHEDLSLSNILIDDLGNITGIIDWECASAMPLWMATKVPKFLEGPFRDEEPKRQAYADENPEERQVRGVSGDDELYNEGKNELYWIHLLEYENTQLRRIYNTHMRQLRHGWDIEVQENALKDDFIGAVFSCSQGFFLKRIVQWVDAVEKGEYPRFVDVLEQKLKV